MSGFTRPGLERRNRSAFIDPARPHPTGQARILTGGLLQSAGSALTLQARLNQGPRVASQARLQLLLNQSSRGVAQTQLAKALQRKTIAAAGGSPATSHGVVQRKIGFEFEVEVPLYHKTGEEDLFGGAKKAETKFGKRDRLREGGGFHIVQDHASADVSGVKTIPEFVIHETEENRPEAEFLSNVREAQEFVARAEGQPYPNRGIAALSREAFAGDAVLPLTESRQGGAQATFGILPEGVAALFQNKTERFAGRSLLEESSILEGAQAAVKKIMTDRDLAASLEAEKIEGFLRLICMYCVSNSKRELQTGPALDKNKVPFLVRSTMGEISARTLSEQSRTLLRTHAERLAVDIIGVTGASGGEPIISPTSAEREKVPNVPALEWVKQALSGTDAPLKWGSQSNGEDSVPIPPERVGPASVGEDTRPYGAVLEERHLVQGQVMVKDWAKYASDVWGYVRRANRIV